MSEFTIDYNNPADGQDGRPDTSKKKLALLSIAFKDVVSLFTISPVQVDAISRDLDAHGFRYHGLQSTTGSGLEVMAFPIK